MNDVRTLTGQSNVFYCILCLCIVTVVLLLYLAIWATISLNTLHFIKIHFKNYQNTCPHKGLCADRPNVLEELVVSEGFIANNSASKLITNIPNI